MLYAYSMAMGPMAIGPRGARGASGSSRLEPRFYARTLLLLLLPLGACCATTRDSSTNVLGCVKFAIGPVVGWPAKPRAAARAKMAWLTSTRALSRTDASAYLQRGPKCQSPDQLGAGSRVRLWLGVHHVAARRDP